MVGILEQIYETQMVTNGDESYSALNQAGLPTFMDRQEGELLSRLIRDLRPAVSLEVGCAYGVSTLHICEALSAIGQPARHIVLDPFQQTKWHGAAAQHRSGRIQPSGAVRRSAVRVRVASIAERRRMVGFALIDGSAPSNSAWSVLLHRSDAEGRRRARVRRRRLARHQQGDQGGCELRQLPADGKAPRRVRDSHSGLSALCADSLRRAVHPPGSLFAVGPGHRRNVRGPEEDRGHRTRERLAPRFLDAINHQSSITNHQSDRHWLRASGRSSRHWSPVPAAHSGTSWG